MPGYDAEGTMNRCKTCDADLSAEARFCMVCGAPVSTGDGSAAMVTRSAPPQGELVTAGAVQPARAIVQPQGLVRTMLLASFALIFLPLLLTLRLLRQPYLHRSGGVPGIAAITIRGTQGWDPPHSLPDSGHSWRTCQLPGPPADERRSVAAQRARLCHRRTSERTGRTLPGGGWHLRRWPIRRCAQPALGLLAERGGDRRARWSIATPARHA